MQNKLQKAQHGRCANDVLMRLAAALALCGGLSGCVVVGASSRGGFFIWPGGLGLLLMIVLVVLLLRRR